MLPNAGGVFDQRKGHVDRISKVLQARDKWQREELERKSDKG